jgi:hypothetical protein
MVTIADVFLRNTHVSAQLADAKKEIAATANNTAISVGLMIKLFTTLEAGHFLLAGCTHDPCILLMTRC